MIQRYEMSMEPEEGWNSFKEGGPAPLHPEMIPSDDGEYVRFDDLPCGNHESLIAAINECGISRLPHVLETAIHCAIEKAVFVPGGLTRFCQLAEHTQTKCAHDWEWINQPGTPDGPAERFKVCKLCGAEPLGSDVDEDDLNSAEWIKNAVQSRLADMAPAERLKWLYSLYGGYCLNCGDRLQVGGICRKGHKVL